MSQIWRKSNWKTSYVIKLYADGVGAPEVDGDAVLVRNHYEDDVVSAIPFCMLYTLVIHVDYLLDEKIWCWTQTLFYHGGFLLIL